jgi:glycerol uptake facilitator-like aquaporin
MFLSRRLSAADMLGYWVAQLAGAVLASLSVWIAFSRDDVASTATRTAASTAW